MLKKFFWFLIVVSLSACIAVAAGLYWKVVADPGKEILPENIHSILGRESHVFYSDGITKLGVFFDKAHRQYVTYSEIPKNFVNALVASEDNRFFDHFGFDIVGILRATIKNVQAGRVVQGGSTLTQQTAKNLFKRSERSFEAKLKELLYALRLEYYYPKEKIFEFYANQFYVSGNGHGLGVAARYYFDKAPGELSLVECAFIAGSVKRPNYYNPFIKKTEASAATARSRATVRLKYVLTKMRGLGMISHFTLNEAMAKGIVFKKGKVGFALDYAMEQVKDAVSSNEILSALEAHNITNVATSGIRIITTIDKELQNKTLTILRNELSRLDVRLRGYEREDIQKELADLNYSGDSHLKKDAFLFGTIERKEGKGKNIKIFVQLDKKLGKAVIAAKGLTSLVRARVKWQKNLWSEPVAEDLDVFIESLEPGDRVWVRVLSVSEDSLAELELEKYPQVQGGALVMKDGAIKSMAGGSENRFFNRAIQAKRTMGSAFKPLVFAAALQLGWNSMDVLKNSRNVFVYHNQPYFPRPDHHSPYAWVSMSWAGVHSENVASVWLLSHLCDQLSSLQLREVASKVGLRPKVVDGEVEPYRTYSARIRDRYGIQVNRATLREAAYRAAVENLETDFIFDGMTEEYKQLKNLRYGRNFDAFTADLDKELLEGEKTLTQYEKKELNLRKSLLKNYYLMLVSLRKEFEAYRFSVSNGEDFVAYDPFEIMKKTSGLFVDNSTGKFSFQVADGMNESLQHVENTDLRRYLQAMDDIDRQLFWEKVQLNGSLSVGAFDKVEQQVGDEFQKMLKKLPYSIDILTHIEDFRITVGLYYLIELGRQLGIKSVLEPVLSFPLGSNVVSLLEATRMYEGLITGTVTTFEDKKDDDDNDALAIIDRIESADGDILYKPRPIRKNIIGRQTSLSVGHILENVVKFGTGRMAAKRVRLNKARRGLDPEFSDMDLPIPLLGKTGTANRYTNASFFGYLPGIDENKTALAIKDGYSIGVYVGFDNNKSMRRKSSRISGSAGALPAWCSIVNVLLDEGELASRLDPVDLSFYGLVIKRQADALVNVRVDPKQGGAVVEPVEMVSESARNIPSILTFGEKMEAGRLRPNRYYQPFWKTMDGEIQ